ncbi:MAG TPA: hypothetical protein H9841_00215 [Candidatus Flavonifractor merdigallinarum]|uniref:Uncharacterized protein n=1 Tax=Candidatus Flavonifractor merdigallinarum TaxID=2838589 RepID=A0A9D1Y5Y4_9FIRM|nr:hypothetical protein [Candidatus Flavonifractor merdigallinarum]
MASEYLKWKYRDVQPEQPIELTPQQKRANWWYYHKWQVLLGTGVFAVVLYLVARGLGFGQVTPDYQVAYVGSAALPEDTVAALESALADLGTDCNGDGRVVVRLNQYVMGDNSGEGAVYAYASSTKLMADLDACDSYFFLLEDPAAFQENYQILRRLDGSLPEETDGDYESCCLSWSACPALRELPLGGYTKNILNQEITGDSQELLAPLFVARRGFWTEHLSHFPEECDALWDAITRGSDQ